MNTMSIIQAIHQQHAGTAGHCTVGRRSVLLILLSVFLAAGAYAQGVGISESAITPDASAILELRSTTRGFLMPRNSATLGFSVQGLSFYNTTSNRLNYHNGSTWLEIPAKTDNLSVFASTSSAQLFGLLSDKTGTGLAVFATSPSFTTPDIGAATGTSLALGGGTALTTTNQTGTGNLVLATSPTLTTPNIGVATGTSLALGGGTALTTTNQTGTGNIVLANTPTLVTPVLGAATGTSLALGGGTALTTTNQTGTGNLVLATSPTLTTPNIGVATGTSLSVTGALTAQAATNQLVLGTTNTTTLSATAPAASRTYTLPDFGANGVIPIGTAGNPISLTTTGTTNVTLPTTGTLANTGVLLNVRVLTTASSSPYTPTAGTTKFLVYVVGAGGQGGGNAASNGSAGGGGGAGGTVMKVYTHASGTYAFTVGAVGTAAGAGANGVNGNSSTFNGELTAGGGSGGTAGNGTTGQPRPGGNGGTATGGDINIPGMVGGHGVRLANTATYGLTGNGGSTIFGNGGAGRTASTGAGAAGTGFGSGGGGGLGATSQAGGVGTNGVIIIYEFR